jgi:DNA repair exonuclease SbcCD ATPase subunit
MKLSISEIEFRNFLSYGDYKTTVDLNKVGPVLIVGSKSDDDNGSYKNSNGAGKSSVTTAILWCLFGRTFNRTKPGDRVVNWFVGRDCYVRIKTSDGWEITRTRKMDGNELEVYYNGEDKTLSTPSNTQTFLNKQFDLDFDIFTSSIFFGQFSVPFLGLSDQKRKLALERLLNLDKLNLFASVAKDKVVKTESGVTQCTTKLESLDAELGRLRSQRELHRERVESFESERADRAGELQEQITIKEGEVAAIQVPNIEKLKQRWEAISQIRDKLQSYNERKAALAQGIEQIKRRIADNAAAEKRYQARLESATEYDLAKLEVEHEENQSNNRLRNNLTAARDKIQKEMTKTQILLDSKEKSIAMWEEKAGQVCPNCQQEISADHTGHICQPIRDEVASIKADLESLENKRRDLDKKIADIPEAKDLVSISEARSKNEAVSTLREDIQRLTTDNQDAEKEILVSENEIDSIAKMVGVVDAKIAKTKPTTTVEEAIELKSRKDLVVKELDTAKSQLEALLKSGNPHEESLKLLKEQIEEVETKMSNAEAARDKLDVLYSHLSYIRAAYSDRNKIKKFILTNLMPVLNKRIQYYLDAFECDFGLEFTPTLSVLPSKWDYDFCSGGEQKRIDMAIMFALHDLYIHMYGPKCNIMVLDEIDGRLDSKGIESFISVIWNDFCGDDKAIKPETILIISHRPEMLDVFPKKLLVRKREEFSFIEPVA